MRYVSSYTNTLFAKLRGLTFRRSLVIESVVSRRPAVKLIDPKWMLADELRELFPPATQALIIELLSVVQRHAIRHRHVTQFEGALKLTKLRARESSVDALIEDSLMSRYYALNNIVTNIGVEYRPSGLTSTSIDLLRAVACRFIGTIHPSGLVPYQIFKIKGLINDYLDERASGEWADSEQLDKLIGAMFDATNHNLPTRYIDAIEDTQNSILNLQHAVAELAAEHEIDPRRLLDDIHTWVIDQDRSGLPPESAGLAPFIIMQLTKRYIMEEIHRILAENPSAIFRNALESMEAIVKKMQKESRKGWRAGKTVAAIFAQDHEATHPAVEKITEQLFAGKPEKIKTFLDESELLFGLKGLSKSEARTNLESLLVEAYQRSFLEFPKLQFTLEALLKELSDPEERKKAQTLLNLLGYGLSPKAQGRVDGPGVADDVDALITREIGVDLHFANQVEKIQYALSQRHSAWSSEEISLIPTKEWASVYYFWIIAILNSVEPGKPLVPSVVVANCEKPEHLWALLYLLVRTNSVTLTKVKVDSKLASTDDLRVTHSNVSIVPLFESRKGFTEAVEIIEPSLKDPLFHSFWMLREFSIMSAASDSFRQMGPKAAAFYALLLEKRVSALLKKYSSSKLVFQLGSGSSFSRSAYPSAHYTAAKDTWRRPTWQPGPFNSVAATRAQFLKVLPAKVMPPVFQEFDEAFIRFMSEFLEPGIDLLNKWTMPPQGRLNQLLMRRQETDEVVKYRLRGFRRPNLALLTDPNKSFIDGARTISFVELATLLGFNVHVILSTVGSFRKYYESVDGTKEEKLKFLQKLYQENPFYRDLCLGIQKQLFIECIPEIWDGWKDSDQALVDELKRMLEEAIGYVLAVSQQDNLIEDPVERNKAKWRIRQLLTQNEIYQLHFRAYPARDETSKLTGAVAKVNPASVLEAAGRRRVINYGLFGRESCGYFSTAANQQVLEPAPNPLATRSLS